MKGSRLVMALLSGMLAMTVAGPTVAQEVSAPPSSAGSATPAVDAYAAAVERFNVGWFRLPEIVERRPGELEPSNDVHPEDLPFLDRVLDEFGASLAELDDGSPEVAELREGVSVAQGALAALPSDAPELLSGALTRASLIGPGTKVAEHFGLPEDTVLFTPPEVYCCWPWWYRVDGQWRNHQVWYPMTEEGPVRLAKNQNGRRVPHRLFAPPPEVTVDEVGDATGSIRQVPAAIDLVLLTAARVPYPGTDASTGELHLSLGVRDTHDLGRDRVGWAWALDVDLDDEDDYWLMVDARPNGSFSAALVDTATEVAVDSFDPSNIEVVGNAISARLPLELVGSPAAMQVRGVALVLQDETAPTHDRVPDVGWVRPFDVP